MQILLEDARSGARISAYISKAKQLPSKREGWKFSWRQLSKVEGSTIYALHSSHNDGPIEGMLMLTMLNEEMLFMNNIEVAPSNFGKRGKHKDVAGCLIAFACSKSIELGIGEYQGYLSFESKTELIELYIKKYGATHAMGSKMFIDPHSGSALVKKYLNRFYYKW